MVLVRLSHIGHAAISASILYPSQNDGISNVGIPMSNNYQGWPFVRPSPRCWFRITSRSPEEPNIAPETAVSSYSTHDKKWRNLDLASMVMHEASLME